MKKVLAILALAPLGWLVTCSAPKVPTPAAIVKQEHAAFPKAPTVAPKVIVPKSIKRRHQVKKAEPKKLPQLPPQQGTICVFPLNMVPQCTPAPAGRMP